MAIWPRSMPQHSPLSSILFFLFVISELMQQDDRKKSVDLCTNLAGLLFAGFVVTFTWQYCVLL